MSGHDDYYSFKDVTENPLKLNFEHCKTMWDVHLHLKEKFGFPDYYGQNWSALWDCLSYLFMEEWTIEIHGYSAMPKDLRECCDTMISVFNDVHHDQPYVHFEFIS